MSYCTGFKQDGVVPTCAAKVSAVETGGTAVSEYSADAVNLVYVYEANLKSYLPDTLTYGKPNMHIPPGPQAASKLQANPFY